MGIKATMDSNGNRLMLHTDHPDTIRMNWLQKNNVSVYHNTYDNGFTIGLLDHPFVGSNTLRGAIDKAMRVSRKIQMEHQAIINKVAKQTIKLGKNHKGVR